MQTREVGTMNFVRLELYASRQYTLIKIKP